MAMGRPKKHIDLEQFKKLCALQCTLTEIAGFFDCSEDTIERWCKREIKLTFAESFKRYHVAGLMSLRRYQFELAKKSAAMAIFLGKNYLGQVDTQKIETRSDGALADLIEGLKETDIDTGILDSETEQETQGKEETGGQE